VLEYAEEEEGRAHDERLDTALYQSHGLYLWMGIFNVTFSDVSDSLHALAMMAKWVSVSMKLYFSCLRANVLDN